MRASFSPADLSDALRRRLFTFRGDESGSMIVLTLFLLVTMLIVGGMAVDFMRFEAKRSHLQGVTDRAVLAAADLNQKLDPKDVVRDYFDKNGITSQLKGDPIVTPAGQGTREIKAEGELVLRTYFLKFADIDFLTAKSASTAIEGIGNIEVSLVLDISGSMDFPVNGEPSVKRIQRLREGATNFVNAMLDDEFEDQVSISLVPYSEQVNAGPELFNGFITNQMHDFSHCIEFPAAAYEATQIDQNTTYQQTQHYQLNPTRQNGYLVATVDQPVCPQQTYERIVPLTQNADLLTGNIAQFQPRSGTSIFLGLKWGVALLDPDINNVLAGLPASMKDPAFSDRPAAFSTIDAPNNTRKYVVLMSDGQNDNSYRLFDHAYDTPSKRYLWANENFPYYRATDLGNDSYWNWVYQYYNANQGDAYMQSMCDAAKDVTRNITIFTIAMGTDSSSASEDLRGKAMLEACASAPSMYYETSGAELIAIFADIAEQITDLRLTQ